MWEKIVAFFMSIIAFFAGLFGIGDNEKPEPTDDGYNLENVSYEENERNLLDLYLPDNYDGKELYLVLYIHGGAWIEGDKSVYSSTAKSATENFGSYGLAGASISYRYLSPTVTMEDILDDIQAAVSCIKTKVEEKGFSMSKMLLTGHSAGGHLALLYSYSRADVSAVKPAVAVSFAGPTDLNDMNFYVDNDLGDDMVEMLLSYATGETITKETMAEHKSALDKISPVYYVTEKSVPTIINHGKKDTIVPYSNAVTLDNKLTQCGVTHIFNIYENSGHGLSDDKATDDKAFDDMLDYISTYMIYA